MERKEILNLKDLSIFQLLEADELQEIMVASYLKRYKNDEVIFSQGDSGGSSMYIIQSGSVKIVAGNNGKNREIIILYPGDFFGEIALFEYVPRTATAISLENTVLIELSRKQFNDIFTRKPKIAAKLLYQMTYEMSRRLRRMTEESL